MRLDWGETTDGCCDCCGGPCHDRGPDGKCCNAYCCTCYPGLSGQPAELEATITLHNCSGGCTGILGTIRLGGPGQAGAGGGVSSEKDALCERMTDFSNTTGFSVARNCRKQICLQNDKKGNPGDGIAIREIWGGGAYLCCKSPTTNAFGCPQEDYEGQDCGGQPFEMSVCCCAGNNLAGQECDWHAFSCNTIKNKMSTSPDPSGPRNKHCSCSCYSVNLHSLPHGAPAGTEGIFCSEIVDQSSSCYSENKPGCPTLESCPMDITFCQCNEGGDGGAEGWMIKAEKKLETPLSCDCCPGRPGMPPGAPGGGGCNSGAIIRALILPVM